MKGYMMDAELDGCVRCPAGTYSDTVGAISCTSCPEGTTNEDTGSQSAISCVGKKMQ